jgi:hypothetical protein
MSKGGFGFERAMIKLALQTVVVAIAVGVLVWLFTEIFESNDPHESYKAETPAERPPIKNGIAEAQALAKIGPVEFWRKEFPKGDFDRMTVDPAGIVTAVDFGIVQALEQPIFQPVSEARGSVSKKEPVISIVFNNDPRAYPLRTLMWHEVVNDTVGGVPVAVTYCPFCDSGIVFDRRLGDELLDFGVTGKLRASNLIIYDRETESWWQQFTGEAISGAHAGKRLIMLPARMESVASYQARHPDGQLLIPSDRGSNPYGRNPYPKYDSRTGPFTTYYDGPYHPAVPPMARVVAVGNKAWSLAYLRQRGRLEEGDLAITWEPGRLSALDHLFVSQGRDVGIVTVERRTENGLVSIPFQLTFAFVYYAFNPLGTLIGTPDQADAKWE